MKIYFIFLAFSLFECLEASSKKKGNNEYVRQNINNYTNSTVVGEARQFIRDGTPLIDALTTFGIEFSPESNNVFDPNHLKVSRFSRTGANNLFNLESDSGSVIDLAGVIYFKSGVSFRAEVIDMVLYIVEAIPGEVSLDVNDRSNTPWSTNELKIAFGSDMQEASVILKNRGESNINNILNKFGYKNKEEYINIEGKTSYFNEDTSNKRINKDTFDVTNQIYAKIGSDNNWHIAFGYNHFSTPQQPYMYQQFLCTNLGVTEVVKESGCAFLKRLDNSAKFLRWATNYARGLDFSKLNLIYTESSSIQTAKQSVDYYDLKNSEFVEMMTVEKRNVFVPFPFEGGQDFYGIKFKLTNRLTTYGIDWQATGIKGYTKLFLNGKLYKDRFEYDIQPKEVTITATILSQMFPANSNLRLFFESKITSSDILLEKIALFTDGVCATFSFGSTHTIITGEPKYKIENSVIEVCDKGGPLQVRTLPEKNEEICFEAKTTMNVGGDFTRDGFGSTASLNGKIEYSGTILIMDSGEFTLQTNLDMYENYFPFIMDLPNFPISELHHSYTVGDRYIRFGGKAIIYNTKFTLQIVYRTESASTRDRIATCLELDVNTEANSKKRQDSEEPIDNTIEIVDPPEPISITGLARVILEKEKLGFNPVTKFGHLRIAIQEDNNFYENFESQNLDHLKCAETVSSVKSNFPGIERVALRIFMSASKADYGCTEGTVEEKKLCNYLKKVLGLQNERFSTQMFYGYMFPWELRMEASYSNLKLKIHDRFVMEELTQRFGFKESSSWPFRGHQFSGKGYINNNRNYFLNTILSISETNLYLKIEDTDFRYSPKEMFQGALVQARKITAKKHSIEIDENLKLEIQGDLLFGPNRNGIVIGGANDIVEQHIYGDATKDRFLACKNNGALPTYTIKDMANAFNQDMGRDALFQPVLTDVCFTYHRANTEWNVSSVGILAEKDLWLHAKTTVQAKSKFGTDEDYVVNVQMKFTGEKKRMIMEQPPMYFYPIDKAQTTGLMDNVASNEEREYKVVFSKGKDAKDVGPSLVLGITNMGMLNSQFTKELKGYITTVAFEGPVSLKLIGRGYENFEFIRNQEAEAKKRTGDEKPPLLTEGFEVKGSLSKRFPRIEFRFTGQGLVDLIKRNYSLLVDGKKAYFDRKKLEHLELQAKITRDSTALTSKASKKNELENMYKEIQSIKRNFRKEEQKMFRTCGYCKSLKAPGFIWDSCHVSDRVGKVSCLQFKKDALKACDAECLAKCDLNKIDAEENAKAIYDKLLRRSTMLEKRSLQAQIYDDLKNKLEDEENLRVPLKTSFQTELNSFKGIPTVIPIKNIETQWTLFDSFERSDSLDFTLTFPPRGSSISDFTIVKNYVVDGFVPSRVAEYYFKDQHQVAEDTIETKEKEMQKSFGKSATLIKNWKMENRDVLRNDRWFNQPQTITKKVTRVFDDVRNYQRPSSFFQDKPRSTDVIMDEHAPWNILRRSNPFIYTNKTVNTAKRMKVSKSASFCTNRRNRIRDYKDMVNYMKSWSDSFDQANMFLRDSKTDIMNGINSMKTHMLQKRSLNNGTFSQKKQRVSKKWVNRLKAGFTNWENEFQQQLTSYYTTSPKIMFREMNEIFTPAEFKSLQSYLQSAPSNALSRSITPDPPLQLIGQTFLNGFASMKTLDDNKKFVNQLTNMISQAEQSSQHCHDEL